MYTCGQHDIFKTKFKEKKQFSSNRLNRSIDTVVIWQTEADTVELISIMYIHLIIRIFSFILFKSAIFVNAGLSLSHYFELRNYTQSESIQIYK